MGRLGVGRSTSAIRHEMDSRSSTDNGFDPVAIDAYCHPYSGWGDAGPFHPKSSVCEYPIHPRIFAASPGPSVTFDRVSSESPTIAPRFESGAASSTYPSRKATRAQSSAIDEYGSDSSEWSSSGPNKARTYRMAVNEDWMVVCGPTAHQSST